MPKVATMENPGVQHYWSALANAGAWVVGGLVAILTSYWTEAPEALRAALLGAAVTIVADTILGVVVVWTCKGRKFSSHAFSRVFSKLMVYLCTLLLASGLDLLTTHVIGAHGLLTLLVAVMICFREASSVLEHSALLGVPWPDALQNRIDLARKKIEDCMDEKDEGSCDKK